MVAKLQGDKSASQSSVELYDPWISVLDPSSSPERLVPQMPFVLAKQLVQHGRFGGIVLLSRTCVGRQNGQMCRGGA